MASIKFDAGSLTLREIAKAIREPEFIIQRIYEEHKSSGFGEGESAILAMQHYKEISQNIYGHLLAIAEDYENKHI